MTELLHPAAGGVGMAAAQLARHWGAEVYGTAGDHKRRLLRAEGWADDHLASSRTLDFEDRFRETSGGRGVDVVLNSLAGEFVDASLHLLAPGGRLVEMGRTDVRDPDQVTLDHPGVALYQAYELREAGEDRIREMFADLTRLFADGSLRPLPTVTWDVHHARDAFRHMAQAKHYGKIVLTVPRAWNPDGTVLITGGTGTIGGILARHLVARHGMRHLLLTGRRGPDAPGAAGLRDELTGLGAEVTVVACDAADRDQLAATLAAVPAAHPLTAVVHAAGVLDDGALEHLTPDRLRTALAPKADAARHLHRLTHDLDLADLVLFSAGAGVFGNAGQANYAAANTYLDALAHRRRADGLPTTSLSWGLWADASAMTGHLDDTDLARVRRSGVLPLSAADGMALFDAALTEQRPHLVPVRLDTGRLRTGDGEIPHLLRALYRGPVRRTAEAGAATGTDGLRLRLAGLSADDRLTLLRDLVATHAAAVLGHTDPDQLHGGRAFRDLGFDSLTAVELRNRLNAATALRLPATLVFDHPTLAELAAHLDGELSGGSPAAPAPLPAAARGDEPFAIVGMACRLPGGVRSPEDLWRLLADGADAIAEFPGDRGWDLDGLYDALPGDQVTSRTREGGFLHDAADFDADFFGISPREALAMDPQQRLLLETAWETFERAGIDPRSVRGSRTGVFAGLSSSDYLKRVAHVPDEIAGYVNNGNANSIVSGRVAYSLGLEGPAVTVDTACSSSLVALHMALQALRAGECTMALAGGVTVMSSPEIIVDFSRQRGLAADGRCKPFAAAADGTGFSEGVGLILVERLSDARRNGHQVLAVVRGSAINQDGASNGLTAPNGPAQQRVIRQALADAGVSAAEVDAVEAHGTGTRLGDPIEAQALLATYGQDHDPERPLLLGSVKSNLGHTQAAAGVAGVMKMVLALRHGLLPKSLHVDAPTPHVDWSAGAVSVLAEATGWPEPATPRPLRAGVSSFGISGTNAHVILEQAPAETESAVEPESAVDDAPEARADRPLPWILSARSDAALRGQARALLAHLDAHPGLAPADIALSLVTRRATLERRAVVVATTTGDFRAGLAALADGTPSPAVTSGGRGAGRDRRAVLVFPGQGSQWAGMGAELLDTSPVFAARIDACADALAPHVDWSLTDVLRGTDGAPSLDRVDVAQPALWAVMVALAEVWRAHGLRPAAVLGHSQGEIAAAAVSGALSLEDAARIVAVRSLAIARELSGHGGMAAVTAPHDDVTALVTDLPGVSVAAVNGPSSVVVSGDTDGLDSLLATCEERGVRARRIPVDYASHSAHVDRLAETLPAALDGIEPRDGDIPFFSTVTADWLPGTALDAPYWHRNLRGTVRLQESLRGLLDQGHDVFVECSPHPVLTAGIEDTVTAAGADAVALGSLRRDDGGTDRVLTALASAHVAGVPVDWRPAVVHGRPVDLPTYAFQRERYWLEATGTQADPTGLDTVVRLADGGAVLGGGLSLTAQPWLDAHRVHGTAVVPATALLDWAVRAGDETGSPTVTTLDEHTPVAVPERGRVDLQITVSAPEGTGGDPGRRTLTVHSRVPDPDGTDVPWTLNATGTLTAGGPAPAPAGPDTWPPAGARPADPARAHDRLDRSGLDTGTAFRTLRAVWQHGTDLLADVELPEDARADAGRFRAHPALLQTALALAATPEHATAPALPYRWQDVTTYATGATRLRLRLTGDGGTWTVHAHDGTGAPVLTATAATRPATPDRLPSATAPDALHRVEWTPWTDDTDPADLTGPWAVVGSPGRLTAALERAGATVHVHATLDDLTAALDSGDTEQPALVVVPHTHDNATAGAAARDTASAAHTSAHRALHLATTWLSDPRHTATRLLVVTEGALATGPDDSVPALADATVWGLLRSAQTEHPGRFLLADLDPNTDLPATDTTDGDRADASATALIAAVAASDRTGEHQFAVRSGTVTVPRLVRADRDGTTPADSTPWGDDTATGTVLVTGGTGTLGPHLARWLADQGARDLVLTSRRGDSAPGAAELVAELADRGCTATVAACDVTDRDAVAALLDRLAAEGRTVRSVFHTAAVIELQSIDETSLDAFAGVVHAKTAGATHLDDLLDDDQLDAFVLYSSTAGLWGSGRHAAYVAANAHLNALAEHRRARGARATAISWGIWADDMKLGRVDPSQIRRSGLVFMNPELALAGLRGALDADEGVLAVADVDWDRYHPVFTSSRPTDLFEDVPDVRRLTEESQARAADGGEFAGRLRALPAGEQDRLLLDLVRSEAATVLGHASPDVLSERRAFRDVGFDSLTAVDLRNRLAAVTGLTLPSTLVFDYPDPLTLVAHLRGLIGGPGTEDDGPVRTTAAVDEPIAIIGMSCRYPGGVTSPEALWDLVAAGGDAITGFPADRGWDADALYDPDPAKPGTTYSTQGGFLHDVADFDAAFFGISPREALAMDPQQRLLLETGWEVLERAGIDPATLRSSLTGTFIGASYQDYTAGGASSEGAEGHLITGTISSVMSGRLAYTFGLEGPAVTLDTACSSSLVALHLACQSLRNGESTLALAGGVSVMATPSAFTGFSRQRAMAPDGRCKAYAEGADGMSLAEGVGLVLVERLSDARRNGHPVLAVIRGSAVNQDGASNGLTAPNGPSQARVIRQALTNAHLTPADVDVVEGHGTGTALGDPIEAQALLATYGQDRPAGRPLLLGSVKSNIGHTQMASGIAGVMKMVMAMRHGTVPPTLHVDTPSSHVDWNSGAIDLATGTVPWPETGRPRRAAVSSFGLSGTNVHTVVEQAPDTPDVEEPQSAPAADPGTLPAGVPLVLSARTAPALRAQAARLLEYTEAHPELPLLDVAHSLATTRGTLEHRATVLAGDRDGVLRALTALRDGTPDGALVTGAPSRGRLAFLFTGQGSQRAAMGRELYGRHPAFADALDDVLTRFDQELEHPLRDVLFAEEGTRNAALLHDTAYTQPALFALEVALYRLVESWGTVPDSVAGHSIGELAAAHVAGVLSLDDACTLVAARGRLMAALPAGGAMVAVQAAEDEVLPLLEGLEDQVCLAAVNGPRAVVLSGEEDAVTRIAARIARDGRRTRALRVSHAFHSPRMDAMLDDFARVARGLTYHLPSVPLVSTVTGEPAATDALRSPDYWVQQVRATVRFADAVRALARQGHTSFLELGPDGILSAAARDTLDAAEDTDTPAHADVTTVPALRRDRDEVTALTTALARVHVHGTRVDWSGVLHGTGARRVDLPTYAFQHSRYWPDTTHGPAPATATGPADGADAAFWYAVERADLPALGADLGLDDDTLAALVPALSAWRRRRTERVAADARRHRAVWKPLDGAPTTRPGGTWLVLLPATDTDTDVTELPDALGLHALRVTTDGRDRTGLAGLLRELPAPDGGFTGVLSLLALGADDSGAGDPAGLGGVLPTATAVQALGDAGIHAPLWLLTRRAVTTGRADRLARPGQAAARGLVRVAALEHPERRFGVVDLPEHLDPQAVRRLAHLLAEPGDETDLAVRTSATYARRLAHHPASDGTAPRRFAPEGTALITGGTGALGSHVARRLAASGMRHLLLAGRRGPDAPGAAELAAELRELGAEVTVEACDTADRDATAALLAEVPAAHPLTAVVHTAGVLDDGVVASLTPERLAAVLRPKVDAAWHLHELTRDLDLAAFLPFSSIAGVMGSPGQGNYAAANSFLDALTAHRRSLGLAGTSLAWGPWSHDGGMTSTLSDTDMRRMQSGGLPPLSVDQGFGLFDIARGSDESFLVLVGLAPGAMRGAAPEDLPPLFRGMVRSSRRTAAATDAAGAAAALGATLGELRADERVRYVTELVREQAARVLGHATPKAVDVTQEFRELGFDSLTALELRNHLSTATGLRLPATLVFDYPTPTALAEHFVSELAPGDEGPQGPSLLAELDRLEALFTAGEPDGITRAGLALRLGQMLDKVRGSAPESTGTPVDDAFESASADEVFAFIDNELGRMGDH
ncbi:type I polyketide synthase [Streptomyces sp. NPDC007000]|uniref:type I polyketide synthase n=1 Tax=Streptomyces sp. NPDC007000 TaxID=3155357 RepID=UPI0033D2539D